MGAIVVGRRWRAEPERGGDNRGRSMIEAQRRVLQAAMFAAAGAGAA
jgi:hypothetical protein